MSDDDTPKPEMTPGRYHSSDLKLKRFGGFLLVAASIAAVLIRFGVRDGIQELAPVFYATPMPIIATAAVFGWFLLRKETPRLKWGSALVALTQLVLLGTEWHSATPEEAPIKLAFWNVSSGGLGWDGITRQIQSWDADIVGLAESNLNSDFDDPLARRRFWIDRFEGLNVIRFPRGMRLITKYGGDEIARGRLGQKSNYGVAKLQIDDRDVYVVMADLLSGPTLPRRPAFWELHKVLEALPADAPVILMGDMNTPTNSVHIDNLRTRFRNAFEEKGNGFYYSWPMPLPVLPLDQVWINDGLKVGSCELDWTVRSDHRPLRATLELRQLPPAE